MLVKTQQTPGNEPILNSCDDGMLNKPSLISVSEICLWSHCVFRHKHITDAVKSPFIFNLSPFSERTLTLSLSESIKNTSSDVKN